MYTKMSIAITKQKKNTNISQIIRSSLISRPETELLLAFLLNISIESILTHPEIEITPPIYKKFKSLEDKRRKNWPIAYLIGSKEFYGLNFKVSPAVLTPRPETELIIDEMTQLISTKATAPTKPLIIDLGTGSGAIIISLAKELKRLIPQTYRRAEFSAVDISEPALRIAKQNAVRHKVAAKIKFYQGDLLAPLKLQPRDLSRNDLIIAANLPYLTLKQIKKSPSISREPLLALDGGADGLKYYREIFKQLKGASYHSATLFCEIDPAQSKSIGALAAKYFPNGESSVLPDLAGKNRLFILKTLI
jgi:release factor glutamine methyltransferase